MAEARRKGDSAPGILSALAGVGFLVVVGFGLGVVAGLFVEEPSLVLDYAVGNTETVELGEEVGLVGAGPEHPVSPPDDTVPPSTRPPDAPARPAAEKPPSVAPAEKAAPAMRPAEVATRRPAAAPKTAGGFAVQVGAFGESAAAQALADRLRGDGYDVYVSPSAPDAGPRRWRVRVGPVETRPQAERLAERLGSAELPTWVLAEDAG